MAANTPEQAGGWRLEAEKQLDGKGFRVSSPMREKNLKDGKMMGVNYEAYGDVPELTPPSIFARDQYDVRRADIILANMTEVGKAHRHGSNPFTDETTYIPSIGSDFEIAWAFLLNKPVVLIAPTGNPYAEHPFLNGMSNLIRFNTMNEGIQWIVRNWH